MHFLLLLLLLCCPLVAAEPEFKPRLDIDPALQGIWTVIAGSNDEGKTSTPVDEVIGRATPLTFRFANGDVSHVSTVMISSTMAGLPNNIIEFSNNRLMWCIGQTEINGQFLLQIFSRDDKAEFQETCRYLIVVSR